MGVNGYVLPSGNVLSYQDIAVSGLQADDSGARINGLAYFDIPFVRGNSHVFRDGHITFKGYITLFSDIDRQAFLG